MVENNQPPSSQGLADEIERLKQDVAALKARFKDRPEWDLERALAALAAERAHPLTPRARGELSEEIQVFKQQISALKNQIAQTEEKLAPLKTDEDEAD